MKETAPPPSDAVTADFQPVTSTRAVLGESPVWRAEDQTLWWVDVEGRKLLRTAANGETLGWDAPEVPGFIQLDQAGTPIVGMETGLFEFDERAGRFIRLAHFDSAGVRFNDACVDASGRLWAGTMDLDNARANGVVYVIGPDLEFRRVADGFRTVNGLAWDSLRNRLFFSDSHPSVRRIWTLAVAAEGKEVRASQRIEFACLEDYAGRPDGAAMDDAGCYWIAGVGGGELYRFSPEGRLALRLSLPVEHPTKPVFSGAGLGNLHLTSKRDEGDGGRLSVWDATAVGVRGARSYRWIRG